MNKSVLQTKILKIKDLKEEISYWFYRRVTVKIHRFLYALKLSIGFFKQVLLNSYSDYDFAGAYSLMLFHLENLSRALRTGRAEHSKEAIKSLRVATKLMGQIVDKSYEDRIHKELDQKWGATVFVDYAEWGSSIKFEKETKENRGEAIKDLVLATERSHDKYMKKLELFGAIWHKYHDQWWD